MLSKIFKVIWFVSLFAMMGVLIYCYASWPESVYLNDGNPPQIIGKSLLFYVALGLLSVFNMLAFVFPKLGSSDTFMAWFYGALVCLHFFLISGITFITTFNSMENYNYTNMAPLLYSSLGLLCLWMVAGPIVALIVKRRTKIEVSN